MREKQQCFWCKDTTDQGYFKKQGYPRKDGTQLRRFMCNACNNKNCRKYYNKHADKARQIVYRSIAKHKDKQNARHTLYLAVREGKLTRPTNCEDCGKKCKPHGHHEDYTKPLEVNWVCTTCHSNRHQEHRTVVNTSTIAYNITV